MKSKRWKQKPGQGASRKSVAWGDDHQQVRGSDQSWFLTAQELRESHTAMSTAGFATSECPCLASEITTTSLCTLRFVASSIDAAQWHFTTFSVSLHGYAKVGQRKSFGGHSKVMYRKRGLMHMVEAASESTGLSTPYKAQFRTISPSVSKNIS